MGWMVWKQLMCLFQIDKWKTELEMVHLSNDKVALTALLNSFEEHDAGTTNGKFLDEVFIDLS